MIKGYIFDPIAILEITEAAVWYGVRSEIAGENFRLEVFRTIELICKHPHRARNEYKNFREIILRKFPYTLVYFVENETIIITSVFHQKRNPKKKYDK